MNDKLSSRRTARLDHSVKKLAHPFLRYGELAALLRDDATARSLLLSNLFIIALALVEHWPLKTVMFIYCSQNVIIGVFNVLRILCVRSVPVPGKPDAAVPPPAKYFLAGFFAVHYGLFQFGYYQFIGRPASGEWGWIVLSLLAFFAHHLYSFVRHVRVEVNAQDIVRLMFFPYLRIVPMHLTIIFGGFVMMLLRNDFAERLVLTGFLLLKTSADLKMHQVEHAITESPGSAPGDPLPEDSNRGAVH